MALVISNKKHDLLSKIYANGQCTLDTSSINDTFETKDKANEIFVFCSDYHLKWENSFFYTDITFYSMESFEEKIAQQNALSLKEIIRIHKKTLSYFKSLPDNAIDNVKKHITNIEQIITRTQEELNELNRCFYPPSPERLSSAGWVDIFRSIRG